MKKYFHYIRWGFATIVAVCSVLPFIGKFYEIKIFDIQLIALLQNVLIAGTFSSVLILAILFVISLLFGRIYCSTLCPLGLLQEMFMLVLRRKVCFEKNRVYKYFLAMIVFSSLVGGSVFIARLIDPYSIFGKALSYEMYGLSFVVVLLILVFFKGRFFCSNICPVGTVLGVLAKRSLFKISINEKCISCGMCSKQCPVGCIDFNNKKVNNEECIKCFKCLKECRKDAICYKKDEKKAKEPAFSIKRRQLLIGGTLLVVCAGAFKSGLLYSKEVLKKATKVILPAGGGNTERFINRCLNCNLCVEQCPMKIIKKASNNFGAVHIEYGDSSYCNFECNRCSDVCPSGAIKRLSLDEKQKTQIALAKIDESKCIKCGLCVMKCPRSIITKDGMVVPYIDKLKCIGCGACKTVCPVKAIEMVYIDEQKILD